MHVHVMLSRAISFNIADLNAMIHQAKVRGLNGFALTEHINAPGYWSTYELLKQKYPYSEGFYQVEPNFFIVNGAEISLLHGGDLIALGKQECIKKLDKKLGLNSGRRPPLPEVLNQVGDELVLIGAHPYRPMGGLLKFGTGYLKRLTALEINGKDYGIEPDVRKVAAELGLSVVGGSDAHYWPQVGISCTGLPDVAQNISAIKKAIIRGLSDVRRAPDARYVVEMCNSYKKGVKEMLGLPRSPNKVRQLNLNLT
jgi:hypothetical protein